MKSLPALALAALLACNAASATTITVVPVFEPLSLHDTDGDEAISDTGEALQACVMSRPMALTGGFPEDLVHAIRTPHRIVSNNPNYQVQEANLLLLCGILLRAEMVQGILVIHVNVAAMKVPQGIDLTARQILNLTIVAIRKTLEVYQAEQQKPLPCKLVVDGTGEANASLRDLEAQFVIGQN